MIKYNILLLILILSGESFSQIVIKEISVNDNRLEIVVIMEPFLEKELALYYDESCPSELAIPKRNLIIRIPRLKIIGIEPSVRNQISYKFIPNINPEIIMVDSLIKYISTPPVYKIYSNDEIVIVNGFLWVNNSYYISMDINQCKYNDLRREITEITELNISLIYDEQLPKSFEVKALDNLNSTIPDYQGVNIYEYKDNPDNHNSWIDYSRDCIKIKTSEYGIYRITYEDLKKWNLHLQNPGSFNLYSKGIRVPIYISGDENNVFQTGDYIEFYGEKNMGGNHREPCSYDKPYNEYLNRYSDTTIYWLTWGEGERCRVQLQDGNDLYSSDTLSYYTEVLHMEKNNWFDFSTDQLLRREFPFWIENKTWGWHSLKVGSSIYEFDANDIYSSEKADIYIKLQSYASAIKEKSHHLGIRLNSCLATDLGFLNKYEQKVIAETYISDSLNNGRNKLHLISYPTSSDINSLFIDWIEVEYPRHLKLIDDSLTFRFIYLESPSVKTIKVSNVLYQDYTIWKQGEVLKKYINLNYLNKTMTLTDTLHSSDRLTMIRENRYLKPLMEPPARFNNLYDTSRRADYILITNNNFLQAAEEYIEFIETSYKISAVVINVDDIYNEFNYGFFNPEALREFLKYTYYNWRKPSPEFVFLVGDGTYDYHRNKEIYQGSPRVNNIVPSFGAPVSDNWFVIWDTTGAYIPMMKIGRIPINSHGEFYHYFHKHQNYISNMSDDWNKRYLFFSGGSGNNQNELDQLRGVNDYVMKEYVSRYPVGGRGVHFYKTLSPQSNYGPFTPAEINNAIDSSALFISYLGHSGTQTWDNGIVDPIQLSNKRNKNPLVTDFGCSTGKFAEPDVVSFSEMFINDGQAIIYIGNSSLGFYSTSTTFPIIFYKKLLQDSVYRISEAFNNSKIELLKRYGTTATYKLFCLTSTFFGDPIIYLPIPAKPDLLLSEKYISITEKYPNEKMDIIPIHVEYFNMGRTVNDSLQIMIKNRYNNELVFEKLLITDLPDYSSSFSFDLAVRNMSGQHHVEIIIDPENLIDEISESNNRVSFIINVSSNDLRLLDNYAVEGFVNDFLEIILPPNSVPDQQYLYEYAYNKDFINPLTPLVEPGVFSTKLNFSNIPTGSRIWVRGKTEGDKSYSFSRSMKKNYDYTCGFTDSISYNALTFQNINNSSKEIFIDTSFTSFSVISAGFNDGKTAVVSKNGQTYVPGGNIIGHHVCVFREDTHEFVDYQRFNLFSGETLEGEAYYRYLDTISSDYLILIGVNDEGRVPDFLKRKLHEFGSIYIDSLRFRSSWALIGRLGAPRGSVPEAFSHPFEGKVIIDTIIKKPSRHGFFNTPLIGPAGKWDKIYLKCNSRDTSLINFTVAAYDVYTEKDTLIICYKGAEETDIRSIDAGEYPFIKILAELFNPGLEEPPRIGELGVKYSLLPELVVTSGGTILNKDTLEAGEEVILTLNIYNAGEISSSNFNISAEVICNNSRETVTPLYINNIPGKEEVSKEIRFRTRMPGENFLCIDIDREGKVREIFKENNSLLIPFFVRRDTSAPIVSICCNGVEVFEGSYISSEAVFKISVCDASFGKTSNLTGKPDLSRGTSHPDFPYVKVWLDGEPVGSMEITLHQSEGSINLEFVRQLKEGEHTVKVIATDPEGNSSESSVALIVCRESRLTSFYNYPNPFSNETWFTFILTSIPDELIINIYTAAGRLVKKIRPGELRSDFNRIYWDGRDEEGDKLANGVYFCRVTLYNGDKRSSAVQKIAIVR
jgi:hypothetical protein